MKYASLLLLLAACTEHRDALEGTQSIEVEMVSPTNPGDVNNRLLDTQRAVSVNLRAKDANGNLDTSFTADIRVYAQFLGTLTPDLSDAPLATIPVTSGVASAMITLPASVLGPATLWFDNGTGLGPDYKFGAITGTSPTLWYRDPFVADLQFPRDETALDALSTTLLSDKQVRVGGSRHGARGALVVTSVFAQGYTVSDVQCATGGEKPTPPCTTPPQTAPPAPAQFAGVSGYDHAMVFTFSAPRDQYGRPIAEGEVIQAFNGGLTEFNGLTEIGFPRTFISAPDRETDPHINRALMPPPVVFDTTWFAATTGTPPNLNGRIKFERAEAGAIEIADGYVCPLDDGPDGVYTKYKQWSIVPGPGAMAADCSSSSRVINLITAGTDFTTDPKTLVTKTIRKVIGIVRPVNIGTFNVWIVYPRGKDDLQLQ